MTSSATKSTYLKNLLNSLLTEGHEKETVSSDEIISFLNETEFVLFQIDPLGRWSYLNHNWERITGYGAEESLGKNHYNLIHPDDLENYKKFYFGVIQDAPRTGSYTLRIICKDDTHKWVRLILKAGPGKETEESSSVTGLLMDINEDTVNTHRLKVRLQFLEKLIEYVPGMIYRGLNNAKWTMEFVSAGCYEITGYQPEDLIKNNRLSFASLIHPEDQQYVWNEVQCALDEHRPFELTYRIITADNHEKWIWEQGQGIFSSSGELLVLEGYITDITQDKEADEVRRKGLLYDQQTGHPNWLLFNDRLLSAIQRRKHDEKYAFVFILLQVDKFSNIENIYGKEIADLLILELQKKIKNSLQYMATVSRANNGSLGILLETIHGFNNLSKVIQNIHEIVLLPVQIYEYEIYATASLGVTLSTKQYESCNELIYDAEQALSRARALGGARHEVFDLRQHAKAAAQSRYEQEVRQAMDSNVMQVCWQPVISLESNTLSGLEAKLTWNHPQRGTLFAEDFVPQISDNQLLMQLWEYMLTDTCRSMNQWKSIPGFNDLGINIQIFGQSLLAADSILRLGESLLESKPSSCSISLGIPEDVFLGASDTVKEMLDWLQSRNISIILDSFGEGVCALATLKRYPLDMIRLHPKLLNREHCDPRFVKSVVSLVHSFDIPVIADRLSDDTQIQTAMEYGIDYVQGNIVSRTLLPSEVPTAINSDFLNIAAL